MGDGDDEIGVEVAEIRSSSGMVGMTPRAGCKVDGDVGSGTYSQARRDLPMMA